MSDTSAPMKDTIGQVKDIEEEKLAEAELSPVAAKVSEETSPSSKKEILHVSSSHGGAVKITEFPTSDAYFAKLAHIKADTFAVDPQKPLKDQPIWVCNRDDLVVDVFRGLISRNVSAVPVLLKNSAKWFGFLDIIDIVRYVVHHFGAKELASGKQKERSYNEMMKEEAIFEKKTVNDLMEHHTSKRNPFHPVLSGYSAMSVVECLAREKGVARVPVIDVDRRIINLVTNSGVLSFLNQNIDLLGSVAKKEVRHFKCFSKSVLTVDEDTMAIDAFNLMVTQDVEGVAICNASGRLRGNLSLRDLKVLGSDLQLFWRLHQTVKNLVVKLRAEFQQRHGRPRTVVYVLENARLSEVISTLHQHSVHRIYVCNDHQNKKPIGVITIQDILYEIIES